MKPKRIHVCIVAALACAVMAASSGCAMRAPIRVGFAGELSLAAFQETIAATPYDMIADRSGALVAHSRPELAARQVNIGDVVQRADEATWLHTNGRAMMLSAAARAEKTGRVVVVQTPLAAAYRPYIRLIAPVAMLASLLWLVVLLTLGRRLFQRFATLLARLRQAADLERMSQAALQASEERYRTILASIEDGYYEVDIAGNLTFFNDALRRILGYTAEELMGMNNRRYMDEETARAVYRVFNQVYRTGQPAKAFDWKLIRKDGEAIAVETSISLIRDADGQPVGFRGVCRDVTERARAAEARAQAEERARRLLEQQIAVNRLALALGESQDLDSIYQTIYEHVRGLMDVSMFAVSSYDPEAGLIRAEYVVREGAPFDVTKLPPLPLAGEGGGTQSRVIRTGEPFYATDFRAAMAHSRAEYVIADNGTVAPGPPPPDEPDVTRSAIYAPMKIKGKTVGVMQAQSYRLDAYTQDDIDLLAALANVAAVAIQNTRLYQEIAGYAEELEKRVEERTAHIQAQYARQEAILRSASDGIIVADGAGEIIQLNPVARRWLTHALAPGDAQQLEAAVQEMVARPEQTPRLLELPGLDLELRAAPITPPAQSEKEAAVVIAIHDITHLRALERMMRRFAANVSHELRTPITTIKLCAMLLERTPPHDIRWKRYLDSLIKEADHQTRLVEDILEISRIDAGRLEMNLQPANLNDLTGDVVENQQTLCQERGLNLEHRPAEPCPVALVDVGRIIQVLNNLVGNSIRYTPAGGRIIVSTAVQESAGRTWATATVEDTGMGITPEDMPHIFERFYRGTGAQTLQISGSGLGLAIVKEIVDLHGGQITVQSEVGKGSIFTIWLPLAG